MQPDDSIKKRAKKVVDAGSLPLAQLQETIDTNDKLDALIENSAPKDVQKIEFVNKDAELAGAFFSLLKGPKGDKGDKGDLPSEEELLNIIQPLVSEEIRGEQGIEGKEGPQGQKGDKGDKGDKGEPGKDGIDGVDGKDGKDGKNGNEITSDEVIDKVNSSKKLIKKERVEGLEDTIKNVAHGALSSLPQTTSLINGKRAKNINFTGATVTVAGDTATVAAGSALTITEVDGSPSGTPSTLKFSNGSVTDNGDGSFTVTTGAGGGGDFSSNTSTSVDGEVVLFSGTGGKTGKRSTLTATVVKSTSGVLSAATADTDYLTPSTAASTYQPLDSDLTTIAGLTATTDNFIQSKGSAWASRTVAQVKTDLGLSGTNSGDQTITLTGDVTGSGTSSFAATLATVNANVGSFTNASITVNGKGLITAASNGTAPVTSVGATGPITSSGGTTPTISTSMATNKLIGRGTAGTGVFEEITLGTNLSLSGTTLNATGGGSSPLTTKGDIYTYSTVDARLPVGTDGQILSADSAQATGLKWIAAGGTGTVTNTGGTLTANSVVLGAGTNDTKVVAGITTDGTSQLNLGVNATTLGKVKMFGNTSGDATIQPSAVAGTGTVITLPATTGTVITTGDTGTVTNTMLAGSIANAKLANSAITIAGTSTSLGGSISQDTITGLSSTGIIKRTAANTLAIATSSTDYAPATSGSAILKGNGSGGFSSASAGTDYVAPGAVTTSGLTMATAKMLGRATAATGAIEEIAVTGSGSAVLATSPTLVTPVLGTPSSGTLTNCTGLPVSGITSSTVTALGVGSLEIGHASDTTLSRVSAGVAAIEGNNILTSATGQPLDATLTSLAAYNTNGILTQTAADTFTGRTITGTSNQISVSNGDGVSGNPTLSLATNARIAQITAMIGDGTNTISAPVTSFAVPCTFAGTITGYTIAADAGTCTIKTWKKATGTAIPTVADVISTSGVSLSTGTLVRSATVSDFTTTTVTANDVFIFQVSASATAKWISFTLEIQKS